MEKGKRKYDPGMLVDAALLSVCFLLGSLGGCLFSGTVTGENALQIRTYLQDFLALAGEGAVEGTVFPILWEHGKWIPILLCLGMTGLGVPILSLLFLFRGFGLSYAAGCCYRFVPEMGILPGICLFGLPAALWYPAWMLLGRLSLRKSRQRIRLGKGEIGGILPGKGVCRNVTAISLILLLLCVLLEYSLLPLLLERIL